MRLAKGETSNVTLSGHVPERTNLCRYEHQFMEGESVDFVRWLGVNQDTSVGSIQILPWWPSAVSLSSWQTFAS